MCAVAAGKHIPRKVILGNLSGSGIACLDGQQTWRSHWYQKHQNDRVGIIVLGQSFSSTWCLQLRKEDKAEVLLRCKHPSLVLYTQERQKYLLSFPQPSSTSNTTEFLQDRPDGLGSTSWQALTAVGSLTPIPAAVKESSNKCDGHTKQGFEEQAAGIDDDSKLGKYATNKPCSRICKDWGLSWSQNQK